MRATTGAPPAVHAHREEVMGTVVSFQVEVAASLGPAGTTDLVADACRLLHRHTALLSAWREGSPLSRLRRGELRLADAPPELVEVLERCSEARAASQGWFDPWAMPGGVDPTGLVKGWSAAKALDVLRAGGVTAALVNAGGDVAVVGRPGGEPVWRVGVRHPWRPGSLACVVGVESAIATSGTYERGPHLVNPRTGQPRAAAASTTVVGPDLATADALATALAVGGDEVLPMIASHGYGAYLIGIDGSEAHSAGFPFVE